MITQYRPSYYQAPRAPSFAGRSVDGKPLDVENGSTFKEIDTGRVFRYDKENNVWIEQKGTTPVQPAKPEQAKTVDLNMATGNQTVLPDEGMTLSSATIIKPDTMIPENIKVGVNIGGVVGTAPMPKAEQTKTVDLDMAAGNQTISPDEGKVLSSVVVTKPTTLVAENIKKDVNIGGVVGTLEEVPTGQYITETYNPVNGEAVSATLHGYTTVPSRQFVEQKSLASVMLPSGLTAIGGYAFSGCVNLNFTSLPSGLTTIGGGAFQNCARLSLTSLPSGITDIKNYTFSGCVNLALIELPSGLTRIGEGAFSNCKRLSFTSLPSGLTAIGSYAFNVCDNLTLTSLPSGITSIGNYTFGNCKNLAFTKLPSGVTSIGSYAFLSCISLTSITFEGTPTSIDSTAFNNCTNLTDIKVPWAEGAVANAPWGATNATITYNYTA